MSDFAVESTFTADCFQLTVITLHWWFVASADSNRLSNSDIGVIIGGYWLDGITISLGHDPIVIGYTKNFIIFHMMFDKSELYTKIILLEHFF